MNDESSPETKNLTCFLWVTKPVFRIFVRIKCIGNTDPDSDQVGNNWQKLYRRYINLFCTISTHSVGNGTYLSTYVLEPITYEKRKCKISAYSCTQKADQIQIHTLRPMRIKNKAYNQQM